MRLAYAFLAEAVEATNGRFFVFGGGIERTFSPGLPSTLPSLAVVAKIRIEPEERGEAHRFRLVALSPNNEVFLPEVFTEFGPVDDSLPNDRAVFHLITINFHSVPITQFGHYRFVLYVEDAEMGTLEFYSDPGPAPPA
jgi:hypothetical protein